ncbi:hypothetical protein [Rhodococcoides fascians]|uniref:hypothetical protein n=1 Tax=Rhodococcoides fascians TaxID=1828 RepID=UPI0024BA9638|nr:hypothetical protein [Rhodococcus fascians]MDJ0412084.1 hypothetical protein [Rhodococcus fascians]
MVDRTSRYPTWAQRYIDEFLTLDEVGQLENITREGVRQRLKTLGIKPRTLKETGQLRERAELLKRGAEIRSVFLATRSPERTAEELAIRPTWVRRYLDENIPNFEVLSRVPRNVAKRYTDEELFESLRLASAEGASNLTATGYDSYVQANTKLDDGRLRPGKQTMWLRFGSWRAALDAAGLPSNPHSGPAKDFDEVNAVRAVVECWRTTGSPPTADGYDRWQRGKEGYPSTATVRKLTGSWNTLLVRCWQVVYGIQLDQEDEDAAVPLPLLNKNQLNYSLGELVEYRTADEGLEISLGSDQNLQTYEALERAVRSHARIQNSVAASGIEFGLHAWSPVTGGTQFDLALTDSLDVTYVVEVKSATLLNIEFQLRIALGQVLFYAHEMSRSGRSAVPIIAIELEPSASWLELLESMHVGLIVEGRIDEDLRSITAV